MLYIYELIYSLQPFFMAGIIFIIPILKVRKLRFRGGSNLSKVK